MLDEDEDEDEDEEAAATCRSRRSCQRRLCGRAAKEAVLLKR
jgi:hypothetical protein